MNSRIEKLIKQFAKLPRVGGRAAQRIVLALLQDKTGRATALADALADAAENIRPCPVCGCLTDLFPFAGETTPDCGVAARRGSGSDFLLSTTPALRATPSPAKGNNCEFCRDPSRANGQLCLVRDLGDVWTLEKSGVFRGRYHILGGLLGGAAGLTPEDLNIASLPARIEAEEITEIIFVLPNTVEGKTTQHYIMQSLEFRVQSSDNSETALCTLNSKLSFTELASGVPLGGDLDYIDDGTLSLAFGRREKI